MVSSDAGAGPARGGHEDVERVVLVDPQDRALGTSEKLAAHREGGRLHRAFSVFLFDAGGRVLLQQRAACKYHFAGRWANACCGHPRPGETVTGAAERRVREELGVAVTLRPAFAFLYEAHDAASGLSEREYDHVLLGRLDAAPAPAPEEVQAVGWWEPGALRRDLEAHPDRYAPWLSEALRRVGARGLLPRARRR